MKHLRWIMLTASLLLTACGTFSSAASAPTLPFVLVTAAPNASPTPTPFQPIPATPTLSPDLSQPEVDSIAPTLPSPVTEPPLPTPTAIPTLDLGILQNTPLAPQPMIDSQVLNNGQDTVNFLLIGSDKRPGGSYRTDTMVIVILRPKDGQVTLISIPRDLWVYIPTWENQRINTTYQHGELSDYPGGGPGLLKDTVQYNLGVRIDHTAMVEFDGFRQIVDTLGGIDVPISCAYTDWRLIDPSYNPYIESNWHLYTTGPGNVHMDGDLALWYARSRQKSSDFDRGRRQQEVLRALFNQVLQSGTLSRIPELYNNLKSVVTTDLGLGDLLQLAVYAPKLTNADIRSYYIKPPMVSSWITSGGAYVLLPNEAALQQMLTEALSPSTQAVQRQTVLVEVMNGTPFQGWETLAASRLNYAGFETRIVLSDRQDYAYSVLIDMTTMQDSSQSSTILNATGLLPGSLIPSPNPNSAAQYRLILGQDYQPCFSPDQLVH